MTEKEFYSLRCGIVVADRFKGKYYVIDSEDVFGNGCINKEYMVYGATELDGNAQIRISKSNSQFYNIGGKME